MDFYQKEIKEVFKELNSSEKGLANKEAIKRLEHYGLNEIKEKAKITPLKIFLNQFRDLLIWILIFAATISIIIPFYENGTSVKFIDFVEAIAIIIILIINAILGTIQEYKAEKSIEALKKLSSLKAEVLRDNKKTTINTSELVPGDIIFLSTGDKVPADARLIEAINLDIQEASLTGESTPSAKHAVAISQKVQVAEQKNMVFSSTIVTRGRGKAIITGTGMSTEIGKIAEMIEEIREEPTPLQKRLHLLEKNLAYVVIIISAIVFIFGIFRYKETVLNMLIWSVSLAVAAVPESLPIVVTICLAIGIQRMIKKNSLIKKLPSVETLGSVTIIASDKTGTLTSNEMTVKKLYMNNKIINVSGEGYSTRGSFSEDISNAELLLKTGVLCNDASLINNEAYGDPTEIALLVSAAKAGIFKDQLSEESPRISELEFDSERKMMTTVHETTRGIYAFTKGAVDVLIKKCTKIIVNNHIRKITRKDIEQIIKINETFAEDALRVLGFAFKPLKTKKPEEHDLIFVGLQGMIDTPREEVKDAIEKCNKAGIKVIMITGDHKITALAIAKQLNIHGGILTGEDLDKISQEEFNKIIEDVSIYARVNPEHKLRIVKTLRNNNHIVGVTGDGVNDAPALKESDIGIAMGITGTDVAKEASDMILVDDNFASIVKAVEEGRRIYNNIKKFIFYIISTNLSEILIIILGLLFNLPLPLLALQILWINLITDGLPSITLSLNQHEEDVMNTKPQKGNILSKESLVWLVIVSIIITSGTLALFNYYLTLYPDNIQYARTVAFTTLIFFELFNILIIRTDKKSIFKTSISSNKWLLFAIIISIILQFILIYTPLNAVFNIVKLKLADWLRIILMSFTLVIISEIRKFIKRKN